MSDGEDYVSIKGLVRDLSDRAVMFAVGEKAPRIEWIPRKLIHGADETALGPKSKGAVLTLRIFRWKARQVGFVGESDAKTTDMFARDGYCPRCEVTYCAPAPAECDHCGGALQ